MKTPGVLSLREDVGIRWPFLSKTTMLIHSLTLQLPRAATDQGSKESYSSDLMILGIDN